MAEILRKQTRYMTRAEFNALDKTAVPVGTEINIVDQIQKEDLSTDLQNAVTSAENLPAQVQVLNISAPTGATNGTFTTAEFNALQASDGVSIMFNHEKYYLNDNGHIAGYKTYTHVGYENNMTIIKAITVTISTKSWVLNVTNVAMASDIPTWHVNELPADTTKVLMTQVKLSSTDVSNPFHATSATAGGLCNASMEVTCPVFSVTGSIPSYGTFSGTLNYTAGDSIELNISGLMLMKRAEAGEALVADVYDYGGAFTVKCELLYLW